MMVRWCLILPHIVALQYGTITRPDISFAVNKVCQFMHSPHYRSLECCPTRYCCISRALLVMVVHFKLLLTCPLHALLMLIGQVAPMTEKVLVVTVSFLAQISSPGLPPSNELFQDLVLNQNIVVLLMLLPS